MIANDDSKNCDTHDYSVCEHSKSESYHVFDGKFLRHFPIVPPSSQCKTVSRVPIT